MLLLLFFVNGATYVRIAKSFFKKHFKMRNDIEALLFTLWGLYQYFLHTHTTFIFCSVSFEIQRKKNTFNLISQLELLSYRYYCGKMCGNEGLWHTMKRSTVNSLIKDKIYVCVWVIFIRNQSSLIHFGLWGKDKRKIKQNKAFVTSNRWPLSCAHQLNIHRHFLH